MEIWFLAQLIIAAPGLFVFLCMLSGVNFITSLGEKICNLKIGVHKVYLKVSHVMLAFSLMGLVLQYLSAQSSAALAAEQGSQGAYAASWDRTMGHKWRNERNFWICGACVLLWLGSWRLVNFRERGILKPWDPVAAAQKKTRIGGRIGWSIMAVALVVIGDLPCARVSYHFQIMTSITPGKFALQKLIETENCGEVMIATATGACKDVCDQVLDLANQRQKLTKLVRAQHSLSSEWAAQFFDKGRGVKQDAGRIEDLFQTRTCSRVLASVDKSNLKINILCFVGLMVVTLLLMVAANNIFGSGGDDAPAKASSGKKKKSN